MIQQTSEAKPRGQHPTVFDAAALRTAIRDAFLKLSPGDSNPAARKARPIMTMPACGKLSPAAK